MPNRRTPHDLKIISGTHRPDRHGPAVQAQSPAAVSIEPPAELGEVGQRVWAETRLNLMASGCLSRCDDHALLIYAQCWERKIQYDAALAAGETQVLPNGIEAVRPQVKLRAACERQIRDFQRSFGMNAQSRAQMNIKTGSAASADCYTTLQLFKESFGDVLTPIQRERLNATRFFGSSDEIKRQAEEIVSQYNKPKGVATRNRYPDTNTGNEAG